MSLQLGHATGVAKLQGRGNTICSIAVFPVRIIVLGINIAV